MLKIVGVTIKEKKLNKIISFQSYSSRQKKLAIGKRPEALQEPTLRRFSDLS